MLKKSILHAAAASVFLLSGVGLQAQPYSNAVVALNPSAYWPLNETTQPPFGSYIATNLGSAGAVAPGYYETWYQPNGATFYETNRIIHVPGPISGASSDQALLCGYSAGQGQYLAVPRTTNGVFNPATTIQAPFTIELWAMTTNLTFGLRPMVTQGRSSIMGDASVGYNNLFAGFGLGQYQGFFYFQLYCTNANANGGPELDMKNIAINTWYHIAVTFDGTTETMYSNGVYVTSATATINSAGLRYVPDLVNPLVIGSGNAAPTGSGGTEWSGMMGEVAIYPTSLDPSHIATHYAAATNSDDYAAAVQADSPSYFFRMNEPAMTSYPSPSSYPVANNYGALGAVANGLYQPGTTPGVAGPSYSGFGGSSRAVAFNGLYGGVDIGNGSLYADLNPTNHQPVSVAAWFRANPADSRFQELVSHGDASWRLAFNGNNGSSSTAPWDAHWNPGNGPELGAVNLADVLTNGFVVNDGKWHLAVGVSDGTTNGLYVDGTLFKTGTAVGNIGGSTLDALIGGSPVHTVPSYNGGAANIRYFDGQIAQVAFWTNSLTAAQISQLYGAAGVGPSIVRQPPSIQTNNAGDAVSIPVVAHGSATLAYQWYHSGGAPVGGQTTANLTFNPVALANAGTYYIVVTNLNGNVTSTSIQLVVNGPPVVTAQTPTNVRVFTGTHPVLRASAFGPQPISYQWRLGGSPISGATASSYQPGTGLIGTSIYNCSITNAYGSNGLNNISVQVLAAPTAPYPVQVLADNPAYYFRLDEPDDGINDGNPGATAWDYAGGCNAIYTNTALGLSGYSQGLANQDGYSPATEPAETSAAFDQTTTFDSYAGNGSSFLTFAAPAGSNAQFSVEAWYIAPFAPGTDGGLVTIGYGFGGEQFALDCGAKINSSRTLRFYVNDASGGNHGISATNVLLGDNLWHHVVAVCDEAGGKLSLYVDGVLNSSGAISPGAGLKALTTPLSIGARLPGVGQTSYTNQFVGNVDDVSLYNYALTPGQVANHFVAAGVPPTIVQAPPTTVAADEGNTVVLSANVLGTATLNYQWQLFGGNINGATTSTLVLPNVTASMSGNNYTLTVNNTYGSATTASTGGTTLTVNAGPPLLLTDITPLNATNYVGNSMTYSVGVGGTAPFTYQWFQDGSSVPNATNASYTLSTLSGQNTYYVHVVNSHGSTNSSTATLVGIPVPTLNPSDYNYKAKITFAGYNRTETLSDFPALVILTNIPGFAYSQLADPNGGDLRFTDASGTRELPHEIDDWNPAGASTVWVQVPRLGTNTDAIWAYWGNPSATTPPAWSTNGGVWTPQAFEGLPAYQIVYHLKEGAFPFLDSTTLHSATTGSATAPGTTAGVVGTAGAFGGTSWLDAGTNDFGDAFTLSAWLNIPSATLNIQAVWMEMHGGFGAPGYGLWVNTYNNSDNVIEFGSGGSGGAETKSSAGAFPFGGWHQLEAVVNRTNGTVNFFVDGTGLGVLNGVVTDFVQTNDLRLGIFDDGNFGIHGGLDEARVQAGNSSANWVWADYMTMGQNSAFQSYGPALSSIVHITAQAIGGGKLVLTWPNGTLLEATSVLGPWTTNLNTSPYTNTIAGPQHFYRVRVR